MDAIAELLSRGVTRLPGVLTPEVAARLAEAAVEVFARLDEAVAEKGPWAVQRELAPGIRYVPTASSLSLSALGELGARVAAVLEAVLAPLLVSSLGAPPRLLVDQAWLRRQRPPDRTPPHCAPHTWHQDGALGFDFLGGDPQAFDALLPMVTAWIPLVDCGRWAPGLRYVPTRRDSLATLAELDGPYAEVEAPALGAGDVVLLHGGTVHATSVNGGMTEERISIELRWLPLHHPGRSEAVGRVAGLAAGEIINPA